MTATFQHFADFEIVTATFNILQSHFELWLQLSTFCSHISNYDCNFQHFAVIFRIMTATFNILRSHFKLWLQNVEICGHISNFAVRNGLLKLMARHSTAYTATYMLQNSIFLTSWSDKKILFFWNSYVHIFYTYVVDKINYWYYKKC